MHILNLCPHILLQPKKRIPLTLKKLINLIRKNTPKHPPYLPLTPLPLPYPPPFPNSSPSYQREVHTLTPPRVQFVGIIASLARITTWVIILSVKYIVESVIRRRKDLMKTSCHKKVFIYYVIIFIGVDYCIDMCNSVISSICDKGDKEREIGKNERKGKQ